MSIDQPFDIVPGLIHEEMPLEVKTVEEFPDGILLFGHRNTDTYYQMKINFEGGVESYLEIPLRQDPQQRIDPRDMMVFNDHVLLVGREFDIVKPGDNYLLCANLDGTLIWKKKLVDASYCIVLQQMRVVDSYGLIFWGDTDYGAVAEQDRGANSAYILTTTFDGEIVKEVILPYMKPPFTDGFLHDDDFCLFGNGNQEYEGNIIWERFDVSSLFH